MDISFRQLQTFRSVMRTGSVSDAARLLGRTQPAVSLAIASLEENLGFRLFDRRKGRLVPRPEAAYFLEEAEAVLDRLARSSQTMREIGNLNRGRLRIACMPAGAAFLMPRLLARFLADKPQVSVSMMTRSSMVVQEWIASQQYDIGLAEETAPRPSIDVRTYSIACLCALPADDPLAGRDAITPADLDGAPMAALYPEHVTHAATKAAFQGMGARFNQVFELQTFHSALELVRHGLCRCVCDPITATGFAEGARGGGALILRPFEPAIAFSVSMLIPAHRPVSELALAFGRVLAGELARIARPGGPIPPIG